MADKGAIDLIVTGKAFGQLTKLEKELKDIEATIVRISQNSIGSKGDFKAVNSKKSLNKELKKQKALLSDISSNQKKYHNSIQKSIKNQKTFNKELRKSGQVAKESNNRFVSFFKTLILFDLARRGVQLFWDSLKQGFDNIKGLQSINLQLKFLVGNAEDVASIQKFLKKTSEDLGVELLNASKSFLLFRKSAELSGLSLEDTMEIFKSVTKAASVLGKSDAEIRNVQVALEQMLSKGTVQAEELKKQLGNVLPGAFQIMALAARKVYPEMEKTNKAFIKMLETGQIVSADILPEFARQLEATMGIEAVKKIETIAAAENRVANAFTSMVDALESEEGRISNVWIRILKGVEDVIVRMEDFALGDFGVAKKFEAIGEGEIEDKGIGGLSSRIRRELPGGTPDDKAILDEITRQYKDRWEGAIAARLQAYIIMDKEERTREIKRTSLEVGRYKAILDAAEKWFGVREEAGDDETEIIIRNIKFLKALIKAESDKLELQVDTKAHDVIEERIRLLKQEIELIEEGQRLAVKVIEGVGGDPVKGITDPGGVGDGQGTLEFIQEQVSLLREKQKLTNDPTAIANLQLETEQYSLLAQSLKSGDYSKWQKMNTAETSKFLAELHVLNPELANYVSGIIDLGRETKGATESVKGLTQEQKQMFEILNASQDALNSGADAMISFVERRIVALEWEMEKIQEKYDLQKELIEAEVGDEESKAEALKQLQKEKEINEKIIQKKIAKEREKQFRIDQAAAIANIGIQTAIGIITALAQPTPTPFNIAMAAIVGAAGLASTIAVASQPVPKFKDGHLAGTHSGLAIVNDGGVPEIIQRRDGTLEMSGIRNQMINMSRGDKVHKSFDSFANQLPGDLMIEKLNQASIIASLNISKQALDGVKADKQFNESLKGVLSSEIKKGFNGVNIRNDNSSVGRAVAQAIANEKYENNFL